MKSKIIIVMFVVMSTFMTMFGKPDKSEYNFYLPMINRLERPYLEWLLSGEKKAEGRVCRGTCSRMRVGKRVLFEDRRSGQWLLCEIKFLHRYETFEGMLKKEGVHNMLPWLSDDELKEGIRTYESFPGSSGVRRLGCVAIGVKPIDSNL